MKKIIVFIIVFLVFIFDICVAEQEGTNIGNLDAKNISDKILKQKVNAAVFANIKGEKQIIFILTGSISYVEKMGILKDYEKEKHSIEYLDLGEIGIFGRCKNIEAADVDSDKNDEIYLCCYDGGNGGGGDNHFLYNIATKKLFSVSQYESWDSNPHEVSINWSKNLNLDNNEIYRNWLENKIGKKLAEDKKITSITTNVGDGPTDYECVLNWENLASRIIYFDKNSITSLRIIGDNLYVASTVRDKDTYQVKMYILNVKDNSFVDCTKKLVTSDKSTITGIGFDNQKNQVWITTNGNGHIADCYSLNMDIIKRYSNATSTSKDDTERAFLENPPYLNWELSEKMKKLEGGSVMPLAYNELWIIIGYFKGNAYIYSFKDKKMTLAYRPSWVYNWPSCGALNKNKAFIGTRGYGLIIEDLNTMTAKRFVAKEHNNDEIQALAANDEYIWIGVGLKGLFLAKIDSFWEGSANKK